MTGIDEYQHLGDLDAPFEVTTRHRREQMSHERIREYAVRAAADAPPLSQEQAETIGRLLSAPRSPGSLMRWRLRLFCGHVVERSAHASYLDVGRAFSGSTTCSECGLDPATIVDARPLGQS